MIIVNYHYHSVIHLMIAIGTYSSPSVLSLEILFVTEMTQKRDDAVCRSLAL